MPSVVRNVGTAKRAKNIDGEEVERQDMILLSSHQQMYSCLNTDTHFIYKSRRIGSTTLCTCGSACVVVPFSSYKQFSSYIGNEVLACQSLIQRGIHADGSS